MHEKCVTSTVCLKRSTCLVTHDMLHVVALRCDGHVRGMKPGVGSMTGRRSHGAVRAVTLLTNLLMANSTTLLRGAPGNSGAAGAAGGGGLKSLHWHWHWHCEE